VPIVVDEVVISVEVSNEASGGAAPAPAGDVADKQVLINECVERVLEILREREEP
jgi:hypothetical protein